MCICRGEYHHTIVRVAAFDSTFFSNLSHFESSPRHDKLAKCICGEANLQYFCIISVMAQLADTTPSANALVQMTITRPVLSTVNPKIMILPMFSLVNNSLLLCLWIFSSDIWRNRVIGNGSIKTMYNRRSQDCAYGNWGAWVFGKNKTLPMTWKIRQIRNKVYISHEILGYL